MLALLMVAAVAAQSPQSAQAAARSLVVQPGRDPNLLHRSAGRGVESFEREQEQALRKLLDQGGPPEEQAEVLARLAATLRAQGLSASIAAQADPEPTAQADRARAARARGEAIDRYRELLRRFPTFRRQDEALFFLADTLQDSGKDDEAVRVAAELVRRFPRSTWAPDSHVFLGEHLFEQGQVAQALEQYRAAAEVKTAEVYPYALYKAAWCRFNQGAFVDAMKLLHQVVQVSAGSGPAGPKAQAASKVQLAREARRDYVTAYARVGRPEAARDEFARLFGQADGLHMLELYGRLLFDTGRDVEAQLVSRQLLALHDDSASAALDQTRLLLLAARTGKKREFIREAQALVEVFRRVRGHDQGEAQKEALAEADRLAEEELRQLAVRAHNEAKKTGVDEAFAAARALYADYLALFPDAEQAYDLRFFDAELLYGLGEKPEAAALYEAVVKQDLAAQRAGRKPGRWEDRAAWGAVLARDENAREQSGPTVRGQRAGARPASPPEPTARPAQRPLTGREELLARSCSLYLEALPQGPHAVEVAFKLGRLRYLSGALDEAREKLVWVATQHPENELAEYAANLVLDLENLRHDSPAVHAWAAKFLADRKLTAHGSLAQDLARVEEQSAYAIADAASPDPAKARALLAFVQAHPRGALADKALFGAAAALSRAGQIDAALEARARIWKELPQSELVPRALLASADDRARVGDLGESAALLEKYAAGFRRASESARPPSPRGAKSGAAAPRQPFDGARAKAALHDAAVLREARGELKLALQDREAELSLWKTAADRDETALAAAGLLARLGMPAQAARKAAALARSAQARPQLAIAAWREAARDFARARELRHAEEAHAELERTWRGLSPKARERAGDEAAAAAAEAHLSLGARVFDDYRRQRIEPPLLRTLNRKVALLQLVKKRDEAVVAMRQAEPAVCALAQLGQAQAMLAQGIAQSPAPRGLTADERKLYRAQLDEKAQPLLEEARETLRGARDRARELGIAGPCAAKVREQLAALGEKEPQPAALARMALPFEKIPSFVDADGRPAGAPASAPATAAAGSSERARRLLADALEASRTAAPQAFADVLKRFRAAAEAAPDWAPARLDLAAALDLAGDGAAGPAYGEVLALPAAPAELLRAAARRSVALSLARGDAKAARELARRMVQAQPEAIWPLELLSEVDAASGDAAAQQEARAVLARAPGSVGALCALARAQAALGAPGAAKFLALRATQTAPDDARPRLLLAELARAASDPAAELSELKAAAAAGAGSSDAALLLGRELWARGLADDAQAQLARAAQLDPRSAPVHLALGSLHLAQKRNAPAGEELSLAAQLAPRAPEPHLELARLRLEQEQDPRAALAEAEKFVQLSASAPPAGHLVYTLIQRSEQALKAGPQAPVVQETKGRDP